MHYKTALVATAATAAMAVLLAPSPPARAQSDADTPMAAILAVEIATLREQYEARIRALEEQVRALQSDSADEMTGHDDHSAHDHHDDHSHADEMAETHEDGDTLAPQITGVLRGMFTSYSAEEAEIIGFQFGHESERVPEGFSVGHSELSVSSDIGNTVRGNLTLGIGVHPGEPTELELEEAYIQTLPGLGLSENFTITAGRKLWSFGYLNERHAHEDDFADRPLPYRAFLDNGFNDDGIQLSLALPGDVRTEIGGGLFRGDDQPFGGSDSGRRALSAYARIGGDMGRDSSWRIGASLLSGEVAGGGGHAHAHDEHGHGEEMDHHDEEADHEDENEHDDEHADDHDDEHADEHEHDDEMIPSSFFSDGVFSGDRALFGTDFRFAWAPIGNARQSELIFQGEYLWQTDDGVYTLTDDEMEEHELVTDGRSAGWYAQAVYKFAPEWRIGARYARLSPSSAAHVDHDPSALAIMGDWTSDRFGQLRLQYNRESLAHGAEDDQIALQYTVSLGGHAGHDH
ncbi:MAG: hypothetical protein OXI75_12200 [Rhodospirillales bacterium]|nr:hypothetical protein [Rhodospirillales bacterium]